MMKNLFGNGTSVVADNELIIGGSKAPFKLTDDQAKMVAEYALSLVQNVPSTPVATTPVATAPVVTTTATSKKKEYSEVKDDLKVDFKVSGKKVTFSKVNKKVAFTVLKRVADHLNGRYVGSKESDVPHFLFPDNKSAKQFVELFKDGIKASDMNVLINQWNS